MPRSKAAVSELGSTCGHGTEFRAHIQFRADDGIHIYIRGPSRASDIEAHKYLDQIRAAGGVGSTREESLKIMVAESRRLQIYADYQAQIKQTVQRMASKDVVDESDYEDDDDISDLT